MFQPPLQTTGITGQCGKRDDQLETRPSKCGRVPESVLCRSSHPCDRTRGGPGPPQRVRRNALSMCRRSRMSAQTTCRRHAESACYFKDSNSLPLSRSFRGLDCAVTPATPIVNWLSTLGGTTLTRQNLDRSQSSAVGRSRTVTSERCFASSRPSSSNRTAITTVSDSQTSS